MIFARVGENLRPKRPSYILFGNETGCVETQLGDSSNGFVSDVLINRRIRILGLSALAVRLALLPHKSGAKRPAGTREALPGTFCRTEVPHFLHGLANQPSQNFIAA
jgi:hypothetical protein